MQKGQENKEITLMATNQSTWIASHVGLGKLIGRLSVGISQFSFTILDPFFYLGVMWGAT